MKLEAVSGGPYIINRETVYNDVIKIYQTNQIIKEYPIYITYDSEVADDQGGITRDMFSGFWEEAYITLFDGVTLLNQTDLQAFSTLGKIMSHGYLVSGFLPVCIVLPSLLCMLLSTSIELPSSILLDALIDYVNPNEREKLKYAIEGKDFLEIKSEVIAVLSRFGCRQVPTIATLPNILLDVARYEFCVKPAAAISIVYNGIPEEHKQFWVLKVSVSYIIP